MTYIAGSSDGRNFDIKEVRADFNPSANGEDWDEISEFWQEHVHGRYKKYAVNVILELEPKKVKKRAETAWNSGERHFRRNALT